MFTDYQLTEMIGLHLLQKSRRVLLSADRSVHESFSLSRWDYFSQRPVQRAGERLTASGLFPHTQFPPVTHAVCPGYKCFRALQLSICSPSLCPSTPTPSHLVTLCSIQSLFHIHAATPHHAHPPMFPVTNHGLASFSSLHRPRVYRAVYQRGSWEVQALNKNSNIDDEPLKPQINYFSR